MTTATRESIRERVEHLSVWKRKGQRAPHKPLLLLLALSRLVQGGSRLIPFVDLCGPLEDLLERYGPPRKSYHPEYPFWWLQGDGLWEVECRSALQRRRGNDNPPKPELIKKGAEGGFPEDVYRLLAEDRGLVREVVRRLVDAHFPESMRDDLLRELGLADLLEGNAGERDAAFRSAVIQAYEHRCAICGYDAKLGRCDVGLEAAHIYWHQAGGPDTVQNGLALCCLHHKAFDRGAVGVNADLRIMVSADLYGGEATTEWFIRFKGVELRRPHSAALLPEERFLAWHRREVFRQPSRE